MTLVDLLHQVQRLLPVRFGGTGNPHGWATNAVVAPYVNGTGSTITRGTVVELANYLTMGGGRISDSRIKPTTTAGSQTVVGVVMGRFRLDDPTNEFEDVDCADGDVCAVVIAGKALATVEGSVAVGQFAYSANTDGAASGSEYLGQGGMGTWETAGSGRQWLRLWGAPATPGVAGGILVVFGDGTTAIQAGTLVDIPMPDFNIRLISWELLSTVTGSISIDIYRDTYGNFPPSGVDSITDNGPPSIVSGIKAQGTVPFGTDVFGFPTGWKRDINVGETLRAYVESAGGGIKQVSMMIRYIRR
jgi:hypothetical protein